MDIFLLGAGFSKWFHPSMPLLKDLTDFISNEPTLVDRINRLGLMPLCRSAAGIEALLSHTSIAYPWKGQAEVFEELALYDLAVYQIANYLNERMYLLPDDLPDAARRMFEFWKEHKSVILTFNYDTIVEKGLSKLQNAYWTAYWKLPTKLIAQRGDQPTGAIMGSVEDDDFNRSLASPDDYPTILKLHGSHNWFIPDGSVGADEIYYFRSHIGTGQSFRMAGLKPFIIPPSVDKSTLTKPNLISKMWLMARGLIETCDRLFIIGYSLPVSDTYVNLFLSKSLPSRTEVILVNSDDSDEFSSRLSNQLAGRVNRGASFLGDRSVDRFVDKLVAGLI
jgi:hypothetical protein